MINLVLLAAILIFASAILSKKPRNDRNWKEPLALAASFKPLSADRYKLHNLRTYEFGPGDTRAPGWGEAELDAGSLTEMWFFVEPFPANALFAHSFLTFVFNDGDNAPQAVSVSIEARMEKGESYSPIKGALRTYELLYVWSTEKDILTRIGVSLDHTLYAYKIDLEPDQMRQLFQYFVRRTNDLHKQPRFYNTLHSNCTNELAKAVNEAFPNALPWHRSWVMTGRSAAWLHRLGFIEGAEQTFSNLTKQSDIRSLVKAHADAPPTLFSQSWRRSFQRADLKEE